MMNAPDDFLRTLPLDGKFNPVSGSATHNDFSSRTFQLISRFLNRPVTKELITAINFVSMGKERRSGETYMHHYRRVGSGAVFLSLLTGTIDEETLLRRYLIAIAHDVIEDAKGNEMLLERLNDLKDSSPLLKDVIEKVEKMSRLKPENNGGQVQYYFSDYYPNLTRDSDLRQVKPVDHVQNTDAETTDLSLVRYLIGTCFSTAIDLGYTNENASVEEFLDGVGSFLVVPQNIECFRTDFRDPGIFLRHINCEHNETHEQLLLMAEVGRRVGALGDFFIECNAIEESRKGPQLKPMRQNQPEASSSLK